MGVLIAFFGLGSFFGGFVLDALFGTWARWWRWWLSPLLIGLAGVGLVVWAVVRDAVTPGTSTDESGWIPYSIFFGIVLPVVMAAGGALVRRWVARSAAKRPFSSSP